MKFQTLSVVAGTKHCDAACPFCISCMTGLDMAGVKPIDINVRNLCKTMHLADMGNVSTAIITGKGEPTLFPDHVTDYLAEFDNKFPFVELQTNGIRIANGKVSNETLKGWYNRGLTTILISNVGYNQELNRQIYMPKANSYINHEELIEKLHSFGFLVRMTCVGIRGGIDSSEEMERYLQYCHMIGADQVTWRTVNKPDSSIEDQDVYEWTDRNSLSEDEIEDVKEYVIEKGTLLRKLIHGARVYDVNNLNVCLSDCLTYDPDEEELRQLIFFPDGKLYTDWQFKGSRLL